jgi:hypothetical protein
MISCFMLEAEFFSEPREFQNLHYIIDKIDENRESICSYPSEALIEIIHEYGKMLGRKRELLKYEGVPFLSLWLKKENIRKILRVNFKETQCLDDFIELEGGKYVKAQPRGIVCHFMAGNVPTLSIFSLIQALLCKNVNLLRVPFESVKVVLELLKPLLDIKISFEGKQYYGRDLLKSTSIIYFPSSDKALNEEMSLGADVRIIWGGEVAVNSITVLPKKTTCKDIIFGPKYSFAVFDRSIMESSGLSKTFDSLAQDIISFDQNACSSPQILFIERSSLSLKEAGVLLSESLEKIAKRYPNNSISQSTLARILNKRGEYLLSTDKDIICNKDLQYTVLMDRNLSLEEPVNGRTIFLKEVEDILDVCKLITSRIQTIGIASEDNDKMRNFANRVSLRGVNRIVKVGCMSFFDSPWDGILLMNELVKWTTLVIAFVKEGE